MSSITFHFRNSPHLGSRGGCIFVRIIHRRRSGNLTLPYRLDLSEWDQSSRRPRIPEHPTPRSAYLEEVTEDMERIREELTKLVNDALEKSDDFSVTEILHKFRFRYQKKGLSEWVRTLSGELIDSGCHRTARAYRTTLKSFLKFCGKKDLQPTDLTERLILMYERSLKERKLSLNTISFYMRNLRAICNKGIKQGVFELPTEKLFSKVYTKVAVSRKRALTKQEIKRLENLLHDPGTSREEKETLRIFMFAFHARGMSFVDLAYLKKSDIDLQKGKLSYFRRKTGQFIDVNLNKSLRQHIGHFMKTNLSSPFLFPIIRDCSRDIYTQYCTGLRLQNQRLKQIAAQAGLAVNLSTHQARHAWATIAKKENIPIWVISEGLGHTSVATTYIYLDSFGASVLDQAHRKVSRAVSKIN